MYKLNTQCVDKGICCVYKAILGKCVVWTTWIHTVLALKAWSAKQQFVVVIILLWSNSLRSGFNITILKNINISNLTSLTNFYRKLVYSEHHIKHHSCLFRSIKWTHYWVISQCTTLNARLIITGLAVAAKNQTYDYIYTFHFSFHRWVCLWVQCVTQSHSYNSTMVTSKVWSGNETACLPAKPAVICIHLQLE